MPPRTAFILAGAVAKGAFEAGALEVLAEAGVRPSQIVAASSGALNAAVYAAGTRQRREREAAQRLTNLWADAADWRNVLDPAWRDMMHGRALSDSVKVFELLRREVPPMMRPADDGLPPSPVELRFVIAPVKGVEGSISGRPATTYEAVVELSGDDLDSDERREKLYSAAVASAAFPLVFAPVEVPGLGPAYDGGVVNNTPVKLAIEAGAERIVLIAPYPQVLKPVPDDLRGLELASFLVDVLIHERLYRDLRDAERVNQTIQKLRATVPEAADRVLALLGWRGEVELIDVRPEHDLDGNAFSGFFNRDLRLAYLDAGRTAALDALHRTRIHHE